MEVSPKRPFSIFLIGAYRGDIKMHLQLPRRAIVSAGACCLLLGFAVPAAATVAAGATAKPAPASAIPRPNAPHSGKMVPGVTGAAARRADPPISPAKRWAELNAASHRAARHRAVRNT